MLRFNCSINQIKICFVALPRTREGESSLEEVQSRQQEGARSILELFRTKRKVVQT
jgi:hypothetical protein